MPRVIIEKLPDNYDSFGAEYPVAECLQYTDSLGDLVTELPLNQLLKLISNAVCNNKTSIAVLGENDVTLALNLETLQKQVDALPSEYDLPKYQSVIVLPTGQPEDITAVIRALETQFGSLRSATGMPADIYKSIFKQPSTLTDEAQINSGSPMGQLPGWVSTPSTSADSISNLWATILDMRSGLINSINTNSDVTSCNAVKLNFRAQLSEDTPGNPIVTIFLDGSEIPDGFTEGLSTVTITDGNKNTTTSSVSVLGIVQSSAGYEMTLSGTMINADTSLNVRLNSTLSNASAGITCSQIYDDILENSSTCPVITYTASSEEVSYSFSNDTSYNKYLIKAYLVGISTPTTTVAINEPTVGTITGTILGLEASTNYEMELSIISEPSLVEKSCGRNSVLTAASGCLTPINVTSSMTKTYV